MSRALCKLKALALLTLVRGQAADAEKPAVQALGSFGHMVFDMDRPVHFYRDILV